MKTFKEAGIRQELVGAVNSGNKGAFGLTRGQTDQRVYLLTQHRRLPVLKLRMDFIDGDGKNFRATEKVLQWVVALMAENEKTPSAQFVLFDQEHEDVVASTEDPSLAGYFFVVAAQKVRGELTTFAVQFLTRRSGSPQAVLADSAQPNAVAYFNFLTEILENGGYDG